jgi:PEGA domain
MRACVAWIVVVAQLAATLARADPAEDLALAHLDRGVAAFRAGDLAHAHAELAEAQRLAPDRPNPYRWLAMTEVELGDCRTALINVESFLSRVPAGDPRVAELVAVRARCTATGRLHVESMPSGAAIRIDGAPAVTTPIADLALPVGAHRLTIEKPGYVAQAEPLEIRAMGTTYARYALIAERGPPVYRRWWFWAAVGAVAITGAGLTYGLTHGGDARLPPVTCDATGCHP